MIELGDKVKDKISGFTGITVGKIEYINGCIQFGVKASVGIKNEAPKDIYWIDEKELSIIKKQAVKIEMKRTGGEMSVIKTQKAPNGIKP